MIIEVIRSIGEAVLFVVACLIPALIVAGFVTGLYCLISSRIGRKKDGYPAQGHQS